MNHTMQVMTASEDMTWATPQEWFEYLNLEFKFTLDPCCVPATAKCKKFYTPQEDGLKQSWEDERVFMNPPYGKYMPKWMEKAYKEARDNGALVVCFVPARVDTLWWHQFLQKVKEVCEKIWDLAWQAYREYQMPYGENDEGMLRWWREMCSIARTREALHRDLAWRALLNRIGDNNAFAGDANPQAM